MYQHIFFDLDHTLWDFNANSKDTLTDLYLQFNLQQEGVDDFEMFIKQYQHHNDRLWTRYRNGFINREALKWKRMWLTLIDFKIGNEKLARALSEEYMNMLPYKKKLMPHGLEILNYCKNKNYELHLITNGFEDTQWKKLNASEVGHYFKEVITSEKSNSLKPHAAIFEYSLKVTGATLQNAIMIGDNLEADILGAKKFGMQQVFYNPERIAHSENPTHEIICLSELQSII